MLRWDVLQDDVDLHAFLRLPLEKVVQPVFVQAGPAQLQLCIHNNQTQYGVRSHCLTGREPPVVDVDGLLRKQDRAGEVPEVVALRRGAVRAPGAAKD